MYPVILGPSYNFSSHTSLTEFDVSYFPNIDPDIIFLTSLFL